MKQIAQFKVVGNSLLFQRKHVLHILIAKSTTESAYIRIPLNILQMPLCVDF